MDKLTTQLSKLSIKKDLGQYFTTDLGLQKKVVDLVKNNPQTVLEPSCGRGDLVGAIQHRFRECQFVLYEIDKSIELLQCVKDRNSQIIYEDFLETDVGRSFDTIVGNPPFVSGKVRNKNMYIRFIEKCYKMLNNDGELIFIVPYAFLKSTSGTKLIDKMVQSGSFTDIYHTNNEKLFHGASVDVIVFRYQKGLLKHPTITYNDTEVNYTITNGIISFRERESDMRMIHEIFDVYVGLVSGLDKVFRNDEHGNISVKMDIDRDDKFIFLDELPAKGTTVRKYLEENKDKLMKRRICKITEKNWYKFGAIRNNRVMEDKADQRCIYIRTVSRRNIVACVDTVRYFGGSLLMMIPKVDNVNNEIDLDSIADSMNSSDFRDQFMSNGRFIISHHTLCNHYIKCHNE